MKSVRIGKIGENWYKLVKAVKVGRKTFVENTKKITKFY